MENLDKRLFVVILSFIEDVDNFDIDVIKEKIFTYLRLFYWYNYL